jgi:NTP pyrophosphatase (non-canonical NTP hydrolase)
MEKIFFNFNEYAKAIHQNAKDKGFYDKPRNLGETFMLIVSELGEALEAHRKGRFANWIEFDADEALTLSFKYAFRKHVKDTFEDEIADVIIRLLDYVGHRSDINIDIGLYEAQGDFDLRFEENVGEILMEVVVYIDRAYGIAKELCFVDTKFGMQNLESKINATLILLLNLCKKLDIDIYRHIEAKMKYNSTRERLHGKAY